MKNIEIIEVQTKQDWKKFVRFPTWLYKGNKFYVHPLEIDELMLFSPKNPSYENVEVKAFLAMQDSITVGRIAVMVHKLYNEKTGGKYARFTRFDFIDDKDVAAALMKAAENWARENGMEILHGPLGFNDFDKEGLLTEGFDKISTFETIYNYAYYKNHVEDLGFEKECEWLEFIINVPKQLNERFVRIQNVMMERLKLHFLPPKMSVKKILELYARKIFEIINDAYSPLHGFTPLTPKIQEALLKQFKTIIKREYICIVLNEQDEVAGFALGVPSIARSVSRSRGRLLPFGLFRILREAKRPKYIDMALIAVTDQYKGKGVNAIMLNELLKNCIKHKIISVETNLELETNTAVQAQFDDFNRELVKRRRCYHKKL